MKKLLWISSDDAFSDAYCSELEGGCRVDKRRSAVETVSGFDAAYDVIALYPFFLNWGNSERIKPPTKVNITDPLDTGLWTYDQIRLSYPQVPVIFLSVKSNFYAISRLNGHTRGHNVHMFGLFSAMPDDLCERINAILEK